MTITYTEVMDSFTTSGLDIGWSSKIISTYGVPANAIVEIVATNVLDGAEDYVGVRKVDSSLERKVLLHEAEDGGLVTARFLVQAMTEGEYVKIKYWDSNTVQTYYIVGYWTGVTFTEKWITLSLDSKDNESVWYEKNLFTSDSIPKGSVCLFSLCNEADGNEYNCGVRTEGSSLTRYIQIHEAEGGGVNVCSMFAKTDTTDGKVEIWGEDYPETYVICQGYFGSDMDFQELYSFQGAIPSTGWNEYDLTGILDQDGRVVDSLIWHLNIGLTAIMGARIKGSSNNRYIQEQEAEGGGRTGFGITTETDADGILEYYRGTNLCYVYVTGYFVFTTETAASTDFSSRFTVTKTGEDDLSAKFIIQKSDESDNSSTFEVAQSGESDNSATFEIQKPDDVTLPHGTFIRSNI